jgi:hypothetical protein
MNLKSEVLLILRTGGSIRILAKKQKPQFVLQGNAEENICTFDGSLIFHRFDYPYFGFLLVF